MRKNLLIAAIVTFAFLFSVGVVAQVPHLIPVQGQLTDSEGLLLDGEVTLVFEIYDAAVAGDQLWVEDRGSVQVTDGFFSVYLGEDTPLVLDDFVSESELWLEMTVDADTLSRIQLASMPYSLEAEVCHQIGDVTEDNMQSQVGSWATDACYDTETELTTVLNDNYLPSSYTPAWGSLSGVPPELWDGTDATNDTVSYDEISSIVGEADSTVAPGIHSHPTSNLITVAQSGGDYASIQDAIDAIEALVGVDAATSDNPYLIWVAPGSYDEELIMQPYIHVQGAGQDVTIITSDAVAASLAEAGTVRLADDVSLRDVTVVNTATGASNVAVAGHDVIDVLLNNVTVQVLGAGVDNYGVYLTGGTEECRVTLQTVTAWVESGTDNNHGLYIDDNESDDAKTLVYVRGGSYTAIGGTTMTTGIHSRGAHAFLEAIEVTALAAYGSDNRGLQNWYGAQATLRGGFFTAVGGEMTCGIKNESSGTILEAINVTARGQSGATSNTGLWQYDGAEADLHGGSFVGADGTLTYGIRLLPGCILDGVGVHTVGTNGSLYLDGHESTSTNASLTQSVIEGTVPVYSGNTTTTTLHNSELIGGTVSTSGTGVVSCVLVTRGTFISDTGSCP